MEPPGVREVLDVSVHVFQSDGSPAVGEPVIILEMMRGFIATAKMVTDSRGVVELRGAYCLPVEVGMRGGGIVIAPGDRRADRSIVLHDSGVPIERRYGSIYPRAADRVDEWRRTCTISGN